MPKPSKNPYVLPGQLANFVATTTSGDETTAPPPTITTTWGTFATALGVSAPLSLRVASRAVTSIKRAGR